MNHRNKLCAAWTLAGECEAVRIFYWVNHNVRDVLPQKKEAI